MLKIATPTLLLLCCHVNAFAISNFPPIAGNNARAFAAEQADEEDLAAPGDNRTRWEIRYKRVAFSMRPRMTHEVQQLNSDLKVVAEELKKQSPDAISDADFAILLQAALALQAKVEGELQLMIATAKTSVEADKPQSLQNLLSAAVDNPTTLTDLDFARDIVLTYNGIFRTLRQIRADLTCCEAKFKSHYSESIQNPFVSQELLHTLTDFHKIDFGGISLN